MSKKPEKPKKEYFCFKCEKEGKKVPIDFKKMKDGKGNEITVMLNRDGTHHTHPAPPQDEPQNGEIVKTTCLACDQPVFIVKGLVGFYEDNSCSTTHQCIQPRKPVLFASQTTSKEEVTFETADKIDPFPGYKVTKIIVAREDNHWGMKEVSDKQYGKGTSKSEGYGKKISSGLEVETAMRDKLQIENLMNDMATTIRIHNKRELTQ